MTLRDELLAMAEINDMLDDNAIPRPKAGIVYVESSPGYRAHPEFWAEIEAQAAEEAAKLGGRITSRNFLTGREIHSFEMIEVQP